MAASRRVILRAGSGSRALPGDRPGRSAAKVTSSSGDLAMARRHDVTARLNGSVGASLAPVRNLLVVGVVLIGFVNFLRRSFVRRYQIIKRDDSCHNGRPLIRTLDG